MQYCAYCQIAQTKGLGYSLSKVAYAVQGRVHITPGPLVQYWKTNSRDKYHMFLLDHCVLYTWTSRHDATNKLVIQSQQNDIYVLT